MANEEQQLLFDADVFDITRTTWEHITIEGNQEDRPLARKILEEGDYIVLAWGPLPVEGGKFDSTRFRIRARRQVGGGE